MQIKEALNALDRGHTIWMVGYARRVCEAFGIPFDEEGLVETWHQGSGIYLREDGTVGEGSLGVDGLTLSQYVAKQLGVAKRAKSYIGQGTQAREYGRVVRNQLQVEGKI